MVCFDAGLQPNRWRGPKTMEGEQQSAHGHHDDGYEL